MDQKQNCQKAVFLPSKIKNSVSERDLLSKSITARPALQQLLFKEPALWFQ